MNTKSITTWRYAPPLGYRGYIYDRDTGLYYLQSRYYDPAIGRFINADTYTTTDASGILSTNMFAYCENNPVNGSDPTGEWVHLLIGAAVGIATQAVTDLITGQASTVADYVSAAIGGTIAASGIGLVGSVAASATLGGTAYLANCGIKGEKVSGKDLATAIVVGGISGAVGGKGADGSRLIGVLNTSKKTLKTAVSLKKISMYKGKVKSVKKDITTSILRFIGAAFTANVGNNVARK